MPFPFGLSKVRAGLVLVPGAAALIGLSTLGTTTDRADSGRPAAPAVNAVEKQSKKAPPQQQASPPIAPQRKALHKGSTTASYFWDDASGRQGDTGLPAIGKPMQKGLFASPSWPLGTKGYVVHKGKKAPFFIGDRGPGVPSANGVMIDIDGKTFADLTGGSWHSPSLTVRGNGGAGHVKVDYVITKWGEGPGTKGAPRPFHTGAWKR